MNIKHRMIHGMIPTVLGTAVTATGFALKNTNLPESYRNGIIGFGIAHITLGSMEMMSKNKVMDKVTKAIQMK